jgi:hypothetical protein
MNTAMNTAMNSANITLFEARPFFEKALRHGVAHGILNIDKIDSMKTNGSRGLVQIARYFGTEFLQPELEKARQRMVSLISLHLEESSGGDLTTAALALRDNTLLSRSKAGADMLKNLLCMPDSTHFGMADGGDEFHDDQIPLLGKWTQKNLTDYRTELAYRLEVQHKMEAAFWFAQALGLSRKEVKAASTEAAVDCEAIIRTCLLMQAAGVGNIPTWAQFETAVLALRKRHAGGKKITLTLPKDLPPPFKLTLTITLKAMMADDMPKILDASVKPQKLFFQNLTLLGRYFWLDDGLDEITDFERSVSDQWRKLTQGHTDDSSLLTLFLTLAVGTTPKTLLTPTSAAALVRKLRKTGLLSEPVTTFIRDFAPFESQGDYRELWLEFLGEAQRHLQDERDTKLVEAMTALRLHCNVGAAGQSRLPSVNGQKA